jgi:AcrR family transcriptional regulator
MNGDAPNREASTPEIGERAARDTRRALLDAGWRIFDGLAWGDLLRAIRVREVAAEAGVTTGAFIHHFSNTERFHAALAQDARDRLLDEADRMFDLLDHTIGGQHIPESIQSAVDQDFDGSGLAVLRRGLLAMIVVGDDPETPTGRLLQQYHAKVDSGMLPRLRDWMHRLDREPMPPFTVADIGVVFSAVSEGLQIRRMSAPSSMDRNLVSAVLTVLAAALTRPRSSDIDLQTVGERLRPPSATPIGAAAREDVAAPSSEPQWREVLAAARKLFGQRPLDEITIDDVAVAAGTTAAVVRRQFGSLTVVASTCFYEELDRRMAFATDGSTSEGPPEDRLEALMLVVVAEARRNHELTAAFLEVMLRDLSGREAPPAVASLRAERAVLRHTLPYTRALREQGRLRRRIDSETLAWTLLQMTLLRALAQPHDTPERVVDDTCDLILHGVLDRPG